MQELISDNYQWLFSGAGVAAVTTVLYMIKKKKSNQLPSPLENTNTNTTTINIHSDKNKQEKHEATLEQIKSLTKILIIDDDTKFQLVNIFKKSGWKNSKLITDIDNLDSEEVSRTHVFFVDIQGVGKALSFRDEGLGLANALMKKYPEKKIIIYSAQSEGDRFNATIKKAYASLPKNADPYEFQQILEEASSEAFNV